MAEWLKLLMEWTPVPAQWAVIAFGLLFIATKTIGSDDLKAEISLYLQGDYQKSWSQNFRDWFDSIFGEKHLSLKCIIRSALASLIGVVALYWFFTWQLGERPGAPLPLFEIIIIGLSVNVIADYTSLRQSRWFLRFVPVWEMYFGAAWGMVASGLLWLIFDIVLSAVIILTALYLYFYAYPFLSGTPIDIPSWGQLFGIYSVYAIFLYSSFLTTIWAVLFFLSVATMRITRGIFSSRFFSAGNYPLVLFSFICAAWVYLLVLGFQGLQKQGLLDDLLCQQDAKVCVAQSKLTGDDNKALDYLSRACLRGSTELCMDSALKYYEGDDSKAAELWAKACDGGNARGCTSLGFMYDKGVGVDQDNTKAAAFYKQGCDGGNAWGCTNLGWLYRDGRGVDQSDTMAVALSKQACDGGSARGCTNLGWIYRDGRGVDQSDTMAVAFSKQGCDGVDARGCNNLGLMYEEGRGVDQSETMAVALYNQACDGGDDMGCSNLGFMSDKGRGVDQDNTKAATLYKQGCDRGNAWGCTNLGWMYRNGSGVYQSDTRAVALFKRGCDGGDASGCTDLGVMYRNGWGVDQDHTRAVALYKKACDGGNAEGCKYLKKISP